MLRYALAALIVLGGCDGDDELPIDTDTDLPDTDAPDVPLVEPDVQEVVPEVATSGGLVYVLGEDLLPADGDLDDVEVRLEDDDGNVLLVLTVVQAEPGQLVVELPEDAHLLVSEGATVVVEHAGGTAQAPERLFVVESTGLGDDDVEPGQGVIGTVYALLPNTPSLPDLLGADPCADPNVDATTFACPHTTILLPRIDVPSRSFETGFPGLGADLVEWFAIDFASDLEVTAAGTYSFELCSDDGSELYLDTGDGLERVIDNDGIHGFVCRTGTVDLQAGTTPLRVLFFQGPRTALGVTLSWMPPGSTAFEIVPSSAYALDLVD